MRVEVAGVFEQDPLLTVAVALEREHGAPSDLVAKLLATSDEALHVVRAQNTRADFLQELRAYIESKNSRGDLLRRLFAEIEILELQFSDGTSKDLRNRVVREIKSAAPHVRVSAQTHYESTPRKRNAARLERARPFMGLAPDGEIAKQFDLSRDVVRYWRTRWGIAPYSRSTDKEK